jgi:hypothetical protein
VKKPKEPPGGPGVVKVDNRITVSP